ncbi:MAG: sensor histidine kinase [Flavobacteriales bacterium]|nr:sensor histidine kinase [Flavobacteriales bacterium]
MLIFLSDELLKSAPLSRVNARRIRLLRAVAYENIYKYEAAEAELSSFTLLFGSNPTDRYYGEYLYRRASLHRVQYQDSIALHWTRQAIRYNTMHGHIKELATAVMVMAYIKRRDKDPHAVQYYRRAAELFVLVDDRLGASVMYGGLAVLLAHSDPVEAKAHLRRCQDLARNTGPIHRGVMNRYASIVHEALGMPDSALHFMKAHAASWDSSFILQRSASVRIDEAKRAYELLAVVQDSEKEASRAARRLTRLSVALGVALVCIATLLPVLWAQMRRIRRQRNELARRQEQLQQLLKDKDVLLHELHHRVKNQLSTVIAIIDHELEFKEALTREQLHVIQQRIHAMAHVHEALLQRRRVADSALPTAHRPLPKPHAYHRLPSRPCRIAHPVRSWHALGIPRPKSSRP